MEKVAEALRVPPKYIVKWFAIDQGKNALFKNGYILTGALTKQDIVEGLDKFIMKYVLCPKCKDPELILRIKKNMVCAKCQACGKKPNMDNNHKVATFMIKNPPGDLHDIGSKSKKKDKEKKSKKERRDKKRKDKKKSKQEEKSKKDGT